MEGGLGGGGGGGDGGGGWWYLRIKSNWRGIHKQWKREIIIQKKKSKKKRLTPALLPALLAPHQNNKIKGDTWLENCFIEIDQELHGIVLRVHIRHLPLV